MTRLQDRLMPILLALLTLALVVLSQRSLPESGTPTVAEVERQLRWWR